MQKVKLAKLVEKALKDELTEKETEKLLRELWKKFQARGLDSFKERLILSANVLFECKYDPLYGVRKPRKAYIEKELEKHKKELEKQGL